MSGTQGLVFDASVLIDYVSQGAALLKLVTREVAPIVVPELVLTEVRALDPETALELGLTIVESTEAQRERHSGARVRWPLRTTSAS